MNDLSRLARNSCISALAIALPLAGALQAQVEPVRNSNVEAKVFKHAELTVEEYFETTDSLATVSRPATREVRENLQRLNINETTARIDKRTGRFVTLMPTVPLIPGHGVGNSLSWSDLGRAAAPADHEQLEAEAMRLLEQADERIEMEMSRNIFIAGGSSDE